MIIGDDHVGTLALTGQRQGCPLGALKLVQYSIFNDVCSLYMFVQLSAFSLFLLSKIH